MTHIWTRGISTLLLALNLLMAPINALAAVGIDEELRPEYAPQSYSEIYGGNEDESQSFSDRDVTYIIADFAVGLLQIAGVLAVLLIVQNGFSYAKAFGRDEEIEKAKKGIIWAILGLVVILLSYALVQNVIKIVLSTDSV